MSDDQKTAQEDLEEIRELAERVKNLLGCEHIIQIGLFWYSVNSDTDKWSASVTFEPESEERPYPETIWSCGDSVNEAVCRIKAEFEKMIDDGEHNDDMEFFQ